MKRFTVVGIFLSLGISVLVAAPPGWWKREATAIIDAEADQENYAPANLGQLKHVAKQAKAYLDAFLPGGSGPAVTALVESFEPRSGESYTPTELEELIQENYAPANLGQLKAVAKPFYDRLLASGYDTKGYLIERGYPANWAYDYPWDPTTPVEENYAPANLGQLKLVFSFNLFEDGDTPPNGLPDWWEDEHFGSSGQDAGGDDDGDGLSNLTEYLAGTDPNSPDGEVGPAFSATGLRVFTPLEKP